MPTDALPSIDMGAASGGARMYDPAVAANPDASASLDGLYRFGASADQAISTGPAADVALVAAGLGGSPTLSSDEANAKYGIQGPTKETSLSWEPGQSVTDAQANIAHAMTQTRIQDSYISSLRPQTWTGWAPNAAGDFLGSSMDPLNTAAAFLPVGWMGRGAEVAFGAAKLEGAASAAAALTRSLEESTAQRIGAAALQNAGAVALTQPLIMAGAQADHTDYTFADAALNVAMGGLLGAGLHGVGELADAGLTRLLRPPVEVPALDQGEAPHFDLGGPEAMQAQAPAPLADGSTARGMLRAGVAAMDSTHTLAPEATEDMLAASRPQVISDLTEQLGRPPTEDEIGSTIEQRSQQFMENKAAGQYDPAVQPIEPFDTTHATPDAIQAAVDKGDYATAAALSEKHANSLEQDPSFKIADDERAAIDQPESDLAAVKSAISDFLGCVQGEEEGGTPAMIRPPDPGPVEEGATKLQKPEPPSGELRPNAGPKAAGWEGEEYDGKHAAEIDSATTETNLVGDESPAETLGGPGPELQPPQERPVAGDGTEAPIGVPGGAAGERGEVRVEAHQAETTSDHEQVAADLVESAKLRDQLLEHGLKRYNPYGDWYPVGLEHTDEQGNKTVLERDDPASWGRLPDSVKPAAERYVDLGRAHAKIVAERKGTDKTGATYLPDALPHPLGKLRDAQTIWLKKDGMLERDWRDGEKTVENGGQKFTSNWSDWTEDKDYLGHVNVATSKGADGHDRLIVWEAQPSFRFPKTTTTKKESLEPQYSPAGMARHQAIQRLAEEVKKVAQHKGIKVVLGDARTVQDIYGRRGPITKTFNTDYSSEGYVTRAFKRVFGLEGKPLVKTELPDKLWMPHHEEAERHGFSGYEFDPNQK
jgi:hypothetical protein